MTTEARKICFENQNQWKLKEIYIRHFRLRSLKFRTNVQNHFQMRRFSECLHSNESKFEEVVKPKEKKFLCFRQLSFSLELTSFRMTSRSSCKRSINFETPIGPLSRIISCTCLVQLFKRLLRKRIATRRMLKSISLMRRRFSDEIEYFSFGFRPTSMTSSVAWMFSLFFINNSERKMNKVNVRLFDQWVKLDLITGKLINYVWW